MNPATMRLSIDPFLTMALSEDIPTEDISTECVMPEAARGDVQLIAKQDGIIAGLDAFERTFTLLDATATVHRRVTDGDEVRRGDVLAVVEGDVRALLSGERVALNVLQRLSGIATYTRRAVRLLEGTGTTLVDTRKTTPGMRILEKEAVRIGGARNHRFNLSDGVLLKDNHIDAAGGITQAVAAARRRAPFVRKIEVEVETLDQVSEALAAGADIIMLDNMSVETMQAAVEMIGDAAETECSGNVTLENLPALASLGVDYISSGALTHSAPILDLSLKHLRVFGRASEDGHETQGKPGRVCAPTCPDGDSPSTNTASASSAATSSASASAAQTGPVSAAVPGSRS